MSASLVGVLTFGGSASASATSVSVTCDTPIAVGDTYVVAVMIKGTATAPAVTPPDNTWTLQSYSGGPTGTTVSMGAGGHMAVFTKPATVAGAQTFAFGIGGSGAADSIMCQGVHAAASIGVLAHSAPTTATSFNSPAVTTTDPSELLLRILGGNVSTGTTVEKGSGLVWDTATTKLGDVQVTSGTSYGSMASEVGPATAGAIVARTITIPSAGVGAATVVLGFPAAVAAVPVNTTAPVVSGTAQTGGTLSSTQGAWSNSPTAFAYQWQRGGAAISGATAATYTVVTADVGQAITCVVTASNGAGSASSTSNSVTPTAAASPANTTAPAITGTAQQGQTLSCSQGAWSASPTSYAYGWQRGGAAIAGATGPTYVIVAADVGQAISCIVTATNANGSGTATSNAVTPTASSSVTPATLRGPATRGGNATATTTAISVTSDASTLTGDAVFVSVVIKGTATTPAVTPPDNTWSLMTYSGGPTGTTVSHPSGGNTAVFVAIAAADGAQTYPFTIGGGGASVSWQCQAVVGVASPTILGHAAGATTTPSTSPVTTTEANELILRIIAGTIGNGSTAETGSGLVWDAACTKLGDVQGPGATGTTWSSMASDVGPAAAGSVAARSITLPATPVGFATLAIGMASIAAAAPSNTIAPNVTGTAQQGQVLTSDTGAWANTPTGYHYQWQRSGNSIAGAVASTYTIVAADVGQPLTCIVTATNSLGSASATSNSTTPTGVTTPVNTALPVISGTVQQGQTITSSQGSWSNSPSAYAYSWRRQGVAIPGATASTYLLTANDVGQSLTCAVTATNAAGSGTAVTAVVSPSNTAGLSWQPMNRLLFATGNGFG